MNGLKCSIVTKCHAWQLSHTVQQECKKVATTQAFHLLPVHAIIADNNANADNVVADNNANADNVVADNNASADNVITDNNANAQCQCLTM